MSATSRRSGALALLGLSFLVASCGGGGGGGGDDGGGGGAGGGPTSSVAGRVIFDRGRLGALTEIEPNDSVSRPQPLGSLYAAQDVRVLGSANATNDAYDGFSLSLPVRVRVTATLTVTTPLAGTLTLSLFDPISMQFVGDATGAGATKTLDFVGKGNFDLVVRALYGASDYSIRLLPTNLTVPIHEVGDAAGASTCLGEVQPGDTISYRGSLTPAPDAADELLVTCPGAEKLTFTAAYPAGQDFDLEVFDATTSLAAPTLLQSFASPANNPEIGSIVVAAGKLLAVRLTTTAGAGFYTLTVKGEALPAAALALARVEDPARVAPAAREAARVERPAVGLQTYGRAEFEVVRGEALVAFDDADAGAAETDIEARGGRIVETLSAGVRRVRFPVPTHLDDADLARAAWSRIRALSTARVRYAEANSIHRAFDTEPDDEFYPLQWALRQLNLPKAWDLTTGSANVIVAVIDTGVRNHPDLQSRLIAGYDFVSDASYAVDGNGRDADPTDPGDAWESFHGTHVCGTIGAATSNESGVAGVTWATKVMPLRALGYYGGTDADIAEAVRYAAGLSNASGTVPPQRANVINMSLGGPGFNSAFQAAVSAARAAGVVIVAAAGNANDSTPNYPAAYADVLSVVATDYNRARAPYSSYGSTVDLAAPGGDSSADRNGDGYADGILSTKAYVSGSSIVPSYEFENGTSMAAPHVAGVAALVFARNPALTPAQVENILLTTTVDLGAAGRDNTFGYGLVDAYAALVAATPAETPPPPVVPASLAAAPGTLNFDVIYTSDTITLSNTGDGFVTVGVITTMTNDGAPWLTATASGGTDAGVSVRRVQVDVSRAGLVPGDYRGTVTIASDFGTVNVDVVMTVLASAPPPPDIDVIVRARRADTGLIVQSVTVNPVSSLTWSFPTLPTGRYFFEASSDHDRDGVLFEDGDYCGGFPILSQSTEIELIEGVPITAIDFSVSLKRVLSTTNR